MGQADILIAVVLVLQAFIGLGWFCCARFLRLSPSAAAHWVAASVMIASALTLFLLRGRVPDLWGHAVGNTLSLAALMAIRRGLQDLMRLPRRDAEQALLLAACLMLNLAWARPGLGAASTAAVVGSSSCVAFTLWRTAFEAFPALRAEFGRRAAWVVATPYGIAALLFSLRAGLGLVLPQQVARPIQVDTLFNLALVFIVLVLNLAINASLGTMVLLRLVRRLQKLSRHDSLTGLFNRRALMDSLEAEAARLRRGGEGSALLVIDADHFKSINDRYGHAAGDEALRLVGDVLKDAIRENDVAARLGGEEFCLLLSMTDREGAMRTGARVQAALAARPLAGTQPPAPLTVSMGVAVVPRGCRLPVQDWLLAADRALYRAKAEGRDRIEVAEPLAA